MKAKDAPLVVVEPVAVDEAATLENLYQLYAHDFSEHVPLDLDRSGRFAISIHDRWWSGEGHYPFFVRANGKLAGFALVERGSRISSATDVMDMAEFFIVRGARRKNVGTRAAHRLFEIFRGRWELRVRSTNVAAIEFWSRAATAWSCRPVLPTAFSTEGVDWNILRIDSSAA